MNKIKRRSFLSGAGTALAASGSARASGVMNFRPNILYIHSHDSGRMLQPYESSVSTPAIAQLAAEGLLFRKAFSAAPVCSPSRAAFLTGQPAYRSGMLGLAHRGFSLFQPQQLLFRVLQQYGYHAVLTGMQHVAADPNSLGYDSNIAFQDSQGKWRSEAEFVAPIATRFLDSKPKQPFFLDVGFFETHRDYPQPTAEDLARVQHLPSPLPDVPAIRNDFAAFGASARQLDQGIGLVLAALERNGYADNTLIIFVTDHGVAFPRMKCNLTDDGIGTALIMKGPGIVKNHESNVMLSQIDVFPTLCDYLGITHPTWLTGKSFLSVLQGKESVLHDAIFSEVTYHAAYEPMRSVRTERWKYIRRFDKRKKPVLPNCDDSPSKSVWVNAGWRDHKIDQECLYDLMFDPTEHDNLANKPENCQTLITLRRNLRQWMETMQDPLLKGYVPPPAGAKVNSPDGLSPSEPLLPV
ncbi:sulfatase family protein [Acetobacter tropicalis]|uniref:Sulfatase n=1 Tax=Acetobacter tropicalis TaxID=104102 RepID=A0A252AAT1_9PROT|nr:sulfatase [Acetobacter tropicalis]OUI86673.1 sulfatase [Acetobacter tropicalis]